MDFGGGETRKSAENEGTVEIKKNDNPKIVIFFNFTFPEDGTPIFIFVQKTKSAFLDLAKN